MKGNKEFASEIVILTASLRVPSKHFFPRHFPKIIFQWFIEISTGYIILWHHLQHDTKRKNNRITSKFTTWRKVSSYDSPFTCLKTCATNLALYRAILPESYLLIAYTHLQPTGFVLAGNGASIFLISSFIVARHNW